ncbi:cholecystokinin receptor type A-like [Mya arenaria]|uniref:cholecystokinin receptor type A-like n=1 Tax=Mya arenaria TaxID=6604 RepID=UPI0022E0C492|nr:cholecystokinin receptor type A-like [Mya arenaria]
MNNTTDYQTESLDELNDRYARALLPLTITFGFFAVFGFFGNLIILLVFSLSRDYKRNNFKVFVLTLAVIDLVICITLIPAEMVKQRKYFEFGDVVTCKVKCFFNVFGASSSCLALLVISIDRFRKVVQPFKKQMTPAIAVRILIVVACVFPILLSIPGTIMCGIKTTNITNIYGGNTTIHLCETEKKYEKSIWRIIYKFTFIILLVGISVTYIVLYTFVMREAAKQMKAISEQRTNSSPETVFSTGIYFQNTICNETPETNRKQIGIGENTGSNISNHTGSIEHICNRNGRTKRTRHFTTKTIICFLLTIVFIVTYVTHNLLTLKVGKIVNMSPSEFTLFSFFFRIYFLNHVINPIVYAIFVKRFRSSCRNVFPMLLGDVELKTSSSGLKYLALNERQTKTRTGSNITDVRDVTPKIFSIPEDIERCPVHAYKLYAVQRPIDFCTSDDPFYIAPRTSSQSHGHDHENWFMKMKLGGKEAGRTSEKMASDGGLDSNKRITNKHLQMLENVQPTSSTTVNSI